MKIKSHYRQALAVGTSVLAVVALLSGCANGGASSAGGKTTLTVYSFKGGGTEVANVPEVNAAFEKAFPNIKLNFTYLNSQNYYQKLNAQLLAGNGPDVFMTQTPNVLSMAASGQLADLGNEPWASRISAVVKPAVQGKDGKIYAAPMELVGLPVYANMDLLSKVGITSVPTTNTDFLNDMTKLKAAGITPLSIPDKAGWTAQITLESIASDLVYAQNKNWDSDFIAGKTTFNKDWASSVQQLVDLDSKGFLNWKNELGIDEWSQGLQDFEAGKSAFWVQGAWNLSGVAKAGIKAQIFAWPADDSGKPIDTFAAGTLWSVNAATKNLDAAKKYINYWSTGSNPLPFLTGESANSPFVGGTSPVVPEAKPFDDALAAGNFRLLPYNSWLNGSEPQLQSALQGMLLGQTDANALLSSYATLGMKAAKQG